ncbi:transcriptional regulator [Leeuwenhoekiella polynyae]|uniref:SatD family protein n=1 Tax=Leeuwenhoekiella polynyae TaxID=1550906 RepID=A0A4Q0PBG1_9FLAO|nr:transcriptional regulator [Leeuwenhoekiella polynyae]RXG24025.1 SatD family protein [Leeuwenhoekiella polynyae]
MRAVLTGDIINSREHEGWQQELVAILDQYGTSPQDWEIYRGDSFQLEVDAAKALKVAIHIKAVVKMRAELDVRIAIGIGNKTYTAAQITQANGSAFIHSGTAFDAIKNNTLVLQSDYKDFDETFNIMLALATLTMDNWPPVTAAIVKARLEAPELNQTELSKQLDKAQSAISKALSRAGYDEVTKMLTYYKKQIETL